MWALLPLLSFGLLYFSFYRSPSFSNNCWRSSFLAAAVSWGVLAAVSTELLGLFQAVTFGGILGFWALTILLLAYAIYQGFRQKDRKPFLELLKADLSAWQKFSEIELAFIIAILSIIGITGLIALVAPPNTWDSMTYHMSRTVHWMQNHSVAHYPTNIQRQLYQNPWAEFAILHFQILSGGSDRLANLIQWFSLLGGILGISLIAKHLGADRRHQILSAVIAATIPMAILQASSTQNDLVLSFWLVCFGCFILLTLKTGLNNLNLLLMSSSLGLCILTKGTGYIYSVPFIIWFFVLSYKTVPKKILKSLPVIALVVFSLNVGHVSRNLHLYGKPLPTGKENYRNEIFSAPVLISNIVRNFSLHLGMKNQKTYTKVMTGLESFHDRLGLDVNDPQITWGEFKLFKLTEDEDYTPNPIHIILMLVSLIVGCCLKSLREKPHFLGYLTATTAAFLLFCLLLKWQAWHSRLHLPLFFLYTPVIGLVLSRIPKLWITTTIALVLIFASLPWVLSNDTRPILYSGPNIFKNPRSNQYFAKNRGFWFSYLEAAKHISSLDCSEIGLYVGENDWEYPLWALLKSNGKKNFRLEHINVNNPSSRLFKRPPFDDFSPCAVITGESEQKMKITWKDTTFIRTRSLPFLSVFESDTTGNLKERVLLFHFNRLMKYSHDISLILNNSGGSKTLTSGDIEKMINLRRRELAEATFFDSKELNQLYPGFGDRLDNNLIRGLELLIEGYDERNQKKYQAGQILVQQWNIWLQSNLNNIKEAFEKF